MTTSMQSVVQELRKNQLEYAERTFVERYLFRLLLRARVFVISVEEEVIATVLETLVVVHVTRTRNNAAFRLTQLSVRHLQT